MIWAVAGTRPEIIKLAPVVQWLRRSEVPVRWLWTGQQKDMIDTFAVFGEKPDIGCTLDRPLGTLPELMAELSREMAEFFLHFDPTAVVVQGDTLSAAIAAQSAFLAGVPVAHVEAGLRTYDLTQPFPEEACRLWIDDVATWKFAPTEKALLNLTGKAYLTGNTGIDATRLVRKKRVVRGQYIVVTMHRRENLDDVASVCASVKELIANGSARKVIWVAHPNPVIREVVEQKLSGTGKVSIVEPQPYDQMVNLIRHAQLVFTDSGGLQEECLALSTPVLVMRETTERPEGVEAGGAMLVGTDPDKIIGWGTWLLRNDGELGRMAAAPNPYGDGYASTRIGRVLKGAFDGNDVRPEQVRWKVKK